jgi:hypothetical protein
MNLKKKIEKMPQRKQLEIMKKAYTYFKLWEEPYLQKIMEGYHVR